MKQISSIIGLCLTVAVAALIVIAVANANGGGSITGKAGNLIGRAAALRKWARDRGFDLAISHNSYAHIAAAAALGIKSVTLMDYEHQPANHLAFRLASRVIVPRAFPAAELKKYGAATRILGPLVRDRKLFSLEDEIAS